MDEVRITVLADNTVGARKAWAEHGLALLVETRSAKVLFDTGQSGTVLMHNADTLGVTFAELDAVVLSHGHYDHTGGLPDLLRRTGAIDVHAHSDVFARKYAIDDDKSLREIGVPYAKQEIINMGAALHLAGEPVRLADDILLIGEIAKSVGFEDVSGGFLVQKKGEPVADIFRDEQAMAVRTSRGLIVFVGCGHPGVINILDHCRRIAQMEVNTVIGGMHLESASLDRLNLTIQALLDRGVKKVIPMHCSGFQTRAEMARRLREVYIPAAAGDTIVL